MPEQFEVVLTKKAQDEIDHAHDWWAEHRSPEQANRWYLQFVAAMISLETNPDRCQLAPENVGVDYELRQLSFGLTSNPTHRAVFVIRDATVLILRIRHLAQSEVNPFGDYD